MVDYCTECNGNKCMKWNTNNGFTKMLGSFIFKGAESCSKYSDSDYSLFLSIMSLSLFILIPINICFGIVKRDKDILLIPLFVTLSMILINIYKSFFPFMERPFQTSINEECTSDEDSDEMKEKYKCAKSSGMPSGHASASIIFILASVFIAIKSYGQGNFDWHYILLLLINIFVSLFAIYSRYELKYHTGLQLLIGGLVGGFLSLGYGYLANNKQGKLSAEWISVLLFLLAVILMIISKINGNLGKEFVNILLIYILPLATWLAKFKYKKL